MRKTQERLKRQQDEKIAHPLFETGDYVLLHNNSKTSKLEKEWLVPYTVIRRIGESNYEILCEKANYIVHANRLKTSHQ